MAYFERSDESNKLITCIICDVKCAERSITVHRAKCRTKHKEKFTKGFLLECPYDTGHVMLKDQMDKHLEFCNKYQSKIVGEYQEIFSKAIKSLSDESPSDEPVNNAGPGVDDNEGAATLSEELEKFRLGF